MVSKHNFKQYNNYHLFNEVWNILQTRTEVSDVSLRTSTIKTFGKKFRGEQHTL